MGPGKIPNPESKNFQPENVTQPLPKLKPLRGNSQLKKPILLVKPSVKKPEMVKPFSNPTFNHLPEMGGNQV